jgi:hypothetical protein
MKLLAVAAALAIPALAMPEPVSETGLDFSLNRYGNKLDIVN